MAVGIERPLKQVASEIDHPPVIPSHWSNGMSYNLGFSSTGVALPAADVPSTQSIPDGTSPNIASQTIAPASQTQAQSQSSKKRRPSKGKAPPEIRRSASTPHMRNLALGTSGELSPTADKRRNKLGYHRTSVACGHCRRRKIRCLLAPDDPHGRCSNCIRLKKECNFYPVEQTSHSEQRGSQNALPESGSNAPSVSATSSPRHSGASANEQVDDYRQYTAMPPTPVDASQVPHTAGLPLQQSTFPYAHPAENQWASPGFLTQSSVAESSPSSSGYWRPSPSTAPSTYGSESNFSGGQTPATMSSASTLSYGTHHEGWAQPPTRSMSYGNIEGLPQYPNQVLPSQHDHRSRTSPYPYPPPLETHSGHVQGTSLAESSNGPLSAPIMAHPVQQQYGYPPPWNSYTMHSAAPEMPMQHRSMSGQWYAEPTPLGQVQEEGPPPMAFSHGAQHFYSGP